MSKQEKNIESICPAHNNGRTESFTEGKLGNEAEDIVHAAEEEFTPEQYRRLLWKIDLVVLPLMWVSR